MTTESPEVVVGSKVTVKIAVWVMKQAGLASRVLEGEITAITPRAICFTGSASVAESQYCHRCGLEITHPVSRLVGYGPICSDYLGIPRPEALEEHDLEEIRKRVTTATHVDNLWFPRSSSHIIRMELPVRSDDDETFDFPVRPANAPSRGRRDVRIRTENVTIVTPIFENGREYIGIETAIEQAGICRNLPDRQWDPNRRMWKVPMTASHMATILSKFDNVQATPELLALAATAKPKAEVTVRCVRGLIRVQAPFAVKDNLKEVPGSRWDSADKSWTYPESAMAAKTLNDLFLRWMQASGWTIDYDERFETLVRSTQVQAAIVTSPNIPTLKTEAWEHQRQAYSFTRHIFDTGISKGVMLKMGMGTGKSLVTVGILGDAGAKRVLIVAPNRARGVWPREFRKHSNGNHEVIRLEGSLKERAENLAHLRTRKNPFVVILNYEAFWQEPIAEELIKMKFDFTVMDESQRIKSANAKSSRFAMRLAKSSGFRLALTGTPLADKPLDAYGQYRYLDSSIFGENFGRFRDRYAVMGGFNNYEVISYQNLDEFAERMSTITYQVDESVLDLPDAVHNDLIVTMPNEARRVYKRFAEDMVASLGEESGVLSTNNTLTKILRLQQMTSGYAVSDDGVPAELHHAKDHALGEFLEDLDKEEPVIVFCRFHEDLDRVRAICQAQGRRYGEISGRQDDLTEDATMPDNIDVMGVQIHAGGAGIDLTRARYCVYYSVGHSLEDYQQSVKRVHRPGQTRTTFYYHIQVENTIDRDIRDALVAKREIVDYISERVKNRDFIVNAINGG